MPVNPELKQKRIMFFDIAFRKLIGNYSVKSACEELILRGLLVQNDKYPNGKMRLKAKVSTQSISDRFVTLDYEKLINYEEKS